MKLHKLYIVEWVDSVQPVASWCALDYHSYLLFLVLLFQEDYPQY